VRIGFLSTDWGDHREGQPGGCTNVRMMIPAYNLGMIGHEVMVGEIGWKEGEGFVAVRPYERLKVGRTGVIKEYSWCFDKLDAVVLKLFMHKDAVKYIKEAKKLGQTVIIDTDDHFEELPSDNLAFITTDPARNADNNRQHLIDTYPVADGIIVSTKFLEKRMLKYNDTVYRVPNSLDPNSFIYRFDFSGNKPTLGWVGIMMWRVNDLIEVSAPIKTVVEQNDLRFHHTGVMLDRPKWAAEALNIDPNRMTGYTGARPQYYGNVFMPIDVGIVPLHPSPFNEAKSSLKGLEYALSGIPFVASSTQEYRDLAESGAGRVAKNNKEWLKHLKQLLDPEVREFERQKNYKVVVEQYNIFTVKYKWSEAIELIDMKARSENSSKLATIKV
jgi:glycosyltransferase involved in cell wall biosynthesis